MSIPGIVNLPIGGVGHAYREIGVPRFQSLRCGLTLHGDLWLRKKCFFVIPSKARDLLFFAKLKKKTDSSGKPSPSE